MTQPNDAGPQPAGAPGSFDEFLNPKSMMTPGVAGSLVMFLTNALCYNFNLQARWVGLGLSAIVGLLILLTGKIPFWQKVVFYFLNSMIIFSVGMGTANLAHSSLSSAPDVSATTQASQRPGIFDVLISTANAQDDSAIPKNATVSKTIGNQAVGSNTSKSIDLKGARPAIPTANVNNIALTNTQKLTLVDSNELQALKVQNDQLQAEINRLKAQHVQSQPPPQSQPQPKPSNPFFRQW